MARVLIIDDDEAFREFLLRMLEELGHTVATAANGFDGVKRFREAPTDLVFTDIMMPYGGQATIRMLHHEFPQLGIVVMTGGAAYRLEIARDLGARAMLAKPFTLKELADAIEQGLSLQPGTDDQGPTVS